MNSAKIRDALLTLLGITALVVYVLACRPSVSPDGTRVVFPIIDQKAKAAFVVLYDLKKKNVETILAPLGAKDEFLAYSAQWLPDGRQVLINGISSILILPFGSPKPMGFIPLEYVLDPYSLAIPPPVVGKCQFLVGQNSEDSDKGKGDNSDDKKYSFIRVNLDTGEALSAPSRGECILSGSGGQVYYVTETRDGDEKGTEVGRLDLDKLIQIPMLRLKQKESGEINPFLALSRDGSRIALTGKLHDAPRILLFRGSTLERTIAVGSQESGITIGNAEWAPNGDRLYVAYTKKTGTEDNCRYGVLEIPVNGGGIREMPLFSGTEADDRMLYFQIALSPDARQILTTSVCLEDKAIKSQDRALYLIDLKSPGRKVTRLAVPFPSAPEPAAEKK
jgi:Tol biopolymer transport system component